jgi:hypothetical protein
MRIALNPMGMVAVKMLVSHRSGSNLSSGTTCELSLFDVLFSPLPQGFFSGFSGFPVTEGPLTGSVGCKTVFTVFMVVFHKKVPKYRVGFVGVENLW